MAKFKCRQILFVSVLLKDVCKLFCRASTSSAYYQLDDKVIDGTKCWPDTTDICVNGKCRVSDVYTAIYIFVYSFIY